VVSESVHALSAAALRSVLDQLSLAIFVFRRERLIYSNPPATRLINRLRTKYRIALTGNDNEPFVVHLMELRGRHGDVAVSVREIGTDLSAFKDRYHLSRREIQVAELVLRGYRNRHIGATLGITPATTKKHLSRIFEKVGVDSRAQLASKLA
jgi:DNA-binding CsgD family transcriptional regulator